ncbi:cytochrome b [Pseudaminobacter sp. NGMCC 1.201702]|uniref:cytochrome b n=1 Tax=Pseudaminobacter sp. NGMCC 1.201702 TaxID=3391825 RepID=UPI0039EEB3B3
MFAKIHDARLRLRRRADLHQQSKGTMNSERYDKAAIWLHWVVAAMVLAQFATGWLWGFFERGSEPRFYLFRIHIVIGTIILVAAVLRTGWRLTHPAPPLPAEMRPAHVVLARLTHGLLYLAILVQPVLGLLTITAFGKSIGRWPRDLHLSLSYIIALIVAVHVAAAFWHQYLRKDGLLLRMVPRRVPRT